MPNSKLKGCKITDSCRSKVVGVACKTLAQLIIKGKDKLAIKEDVTVALEDGTLIEDEEYFETLPNQLVFVFYKNGEDITTGVDVILSALKAVNSTYLHVGSEVAQLLKTKAEELTVLLDASNNAICTLGNTPSSDPAWFSGLETNSPTKEDFMNRRAQDRVRSYLYQFQDNVTKSQIYKHNEKVRKITTNWMSYFRKRLASDHHFGFYFDRRYASKDDVDSSSKCSKKAKFDVEWKCNGEEIDSHRQSFCDATGKFDCEGIWKSNYCESSHFINPYLNRESRIVFSTWNLDHRIEKSRTIVPAVLNAMESDTFCETSLNVDYLYRLLFTRFNLRLVHIVCHDKGSHSISCDKKQLFSTVSSASSR